MPSIGALDVDVLGFWSYRNRPAPYAGVGTFCGCATDALKLAALKPCPLAKQNVSLAWHLRLLNDLFGSPPPELIGVHHHPTTTLNSQKPQSWQAPSNTDAIQLAWCWVLQQETHWTKKKELAFGWLVIGFCHFKVGEFFGRCSP